MITTKESSMLELGGSKSSPQRTAKAIRPRADRARGVLTKALVAAVAIVAILGTGALPAIANPATPTWTLLSPAASPSSRESASMAYDPAMSQLVLFGGYKLGNELNDTWTWDGTTWSQVDDVGFPGCTTSCPASPSGRDSASMAYDPSSGQLVLFGGEDASGNLGDTWTWNGATWTLASDAGPLARDTASMAYDPSSGQLVLFGGIDGDGDDLNDTWTWDGTTWSQVDDIGNPGCTTSCPTSPPVRDSASMAYDPSSSQLVLFGGENDDSGNLNDTWTWDGTTWSQVDDVGFPGCTTSCPTSPSARDTATMADDEGLSDLVLFGGSGLSDLGDTWTWDGTTWSQVDDIGDPGCTTSCPASPSARFSSSMADDLSSSQLVLFGGDGPHGLLGDTWTLSITPSVTVTNNSAVSAGGALTFTAAVGGFAGDPTPTGSATWAVTPPEGGSVPCTSTTGPSGSSNVATYTCSIAGAVAGPYAATATYAGDSYYTSASGSDTSAVVTATPIVQGPPKSGITTTTASSGFTRQLTTTGQAGPVSYVTTSSACGVAVSSSGAVSTSGTLPAGTCTVSGSDSDTFGDSGTWRFTLTVTPVSITQKAPKSGTTTKAASSAFTSQLETSDQNSAVSFVTSSRPCGLEVSSSGAISTTGTLPNGSCVASGTDADTDSDSGTWTFTLTVGRGSSSTTLSAAPSSVSFGGEGKEKFTVTVTGTGGILPTGTVTITDGAITLCSASAFARKTADVVSATCRLSDLELTAGSYSVKAFYSGNDRYNASTSMPASFAVDRDAVTIKVSESQTTVSVGDESQAVFTASLTTSNGESDPNGETVIVDLGTTSCIVTLSNDTGTCTIGNSALRAGSYAVLASFGGDLNLASSTATSSTPLLVSSGSTVPVVPTGKAWSGQLYWWVFGDMALVGFALFEFARRGFRFRAIPGGGGRRSPRHLARSSSFWARSR
jgi:hypothetical protein